MAFLITATHWCEMVDPEFCQGGVTCTLIGPSLSLTLNPSEPYVLHTVDS